MDSDQTADNFVLMYHLIERENEYVLDNIGNCVRVFGFV